MPDCIRRRATMLMMCVDEYGSCLIIWISWLLCAIKEHFGCFRWREWTSEQCIIVEEYHCVWHAVVCHELVKDGADRHWRVPPGKIWVIWDLVPVWNGIVKQAKAHLVNVHEGQVVILVPCINVANHFHLRRCCKLRVDGGWARWNGDDKRVGFKLDVECWVHDKAGPSMYLALWTFKLLECLDDTVPMGPNFCKVRPWGNQGGIFSGPLPPLW